MGLSLDELDPPLDDIAYLSRSNHRIAVFRALADEGRTRRALRETTGVSRPTLGRILSGFEERGWVATDGAGNGHDYTVTPLGEVVVEEFTSLMASLETVRDLRDLAPDIPFDELGLDPRELAAARITTPSPADATAHARREVELLAETDHIRFLCNQAQPETVGRYRDWAVEAGGRLEAIITGGAIEAALADDEMSEDLADMAAVGGVTVHRYEGEVSAMVGLLDDVASIVPLDESGRARAFIESDDAAVRSAVETTLNRYRDRADPVALGRPSQ